MDYIVSMSQRRLRDFDVYWYDLHACCTVYCTMIEADMKKQYMQFMPLSRSLAWINELVFNGKWVPGHVLP